MPSPLPVKYQQQPQQHHNLQQAQPFVKPRRSRLVALLNCACCGGGPAVNDFTNDSTAVAVASVGSLSSYETDSTGKPGLALRSPRTSVASHHLGQLPAAAVYCCDLRMRVCCMHSDLQNRFLHLHKASFCIKDEASCWCLDMNQLVLVDRFSKLQTLLPLVRVPLCRSCRQSSRACSIQQAAAACGQAPLWPQDLGRCTLPPQPQAYWQCT
jgi:hypothetical protein